MLYINTNYYKAYGEEDTRDIKEEIDKQVSDNIQIINLGSSHGGAGFNYDAADINGVNAGFPLQLLYYDYYVLCTYQKNLEDDAVVILPLSYFSFTNGIEDFDDGYKIQYSNIMLYNVLHPAKSSFSVLENLSKYSDLMEYAIHDTFPIINADFNMVYIAKDITENELSQVQQEEENKPAVGSEITECVYTEEELLEMAEETYYLHTDGNQKEISDNALKYFEKIINLCEKKGFTLVLVTTPYSSYYLDNVDYDYIDSVFYNIIDHYTLQYDIEYFDYSDYKEIVGNINNFADDDHLNLTGSTLFTSIVLAELRLID